MNTSFQARNKEKGFFSWLRVLTASPSKGNLATGAFFLSGLGSGLGSCLGSCLGASQAKEYLKSERRVVVLSRDECAGLLGSLAGPVFSSTGQPSKFGLLA